MIIESQVPSPATSKSSGHLRDQSNSFPKDGFSIIVYSLVALTMLGQVGWILWLEYLS